MKKLYTFLLLIITILLSCKEPKNYSMTMPEIMPPLFAIQKGIDINLKGEPIVFEKYIQTRMGNAEANRLYANGDFYKIYLGSNQSIKKNNIIWNKAGVISQYGIDKIEDISNNSVIDYLNEGTKTLESMATKNVKWYYYFDQPKYVQTQSKQWEFFKTPKFVKKTNKVLENSITYD